MSQSYTPSTLEKSKGKLGGVRIFKHSVRDLGRVSKGDVANLRKELCDSKQDERTDGDIVYKKKEIGLNDNTELPTVSTYRNRDKGTVKSEKEPNNYVEDLRSPSGADSQGKRKFTGFRKLCIKQNSILDENRNKRDQIGKLQSVTDTEINEEGVNDKENNIVVDKLDGVDLENWDNELLEIKSADVKLVDNQFNCLQNITDDIGVKDQRFVKTDINNNCIELDIVEDKNGETLESKSNLKHSLLDSESINADENIESLNKVSGALIKKFGCSDLDEEKAKDIKECISESKHSLFHSTPKKEHNTVHVIETSCLLTDKLESCFTTVVEKTEKKVEADLKEFTVNIDSRDCLKQSQAHIPEELSKMRRNHYNSRTFERQDDHHRSSPSKNLSKKSPIKHSNFELPPRFRSNSGDGDTVEQADAFARNGRGDEFRQKSHNERGFRNFNKGRGVGGHGRHEENQNRTRLLDLKVNTPAKFKKSTRRIECDSNAEVKRRWEVPVLEDWSSELLDMEALNDNSCALFNKANGADIDNTENSKHFSIPPVSEPDIDKLYPSGYSPDEILDFEQNASEKRFELKTESSCHNDNVSIEGSQIKFDIDAKLKAEVLLSSQAQKVYLPPIPDEVLASGDKESWTSEVNGNWKNVNECKIDHEGSEETAETVIKVDKRHKMFPIKSDHRHYAEDNDMKNLHEESKVIKKCMQGLTERSELVENVEFNIEKVELETNPNIAAERNIDKVEFTEDSSSLSSIYARKDDVYVNENIANEADGSEFPYKDSKGCMNDGSGATSCKKPDEGKASPESTLANVNQIGYDGSRDVYNQNARYWYDQESMNTDFMRRGQYDPWHPSYLYNYEAYYRWNEQMQMNYYWDMYYRQMQCAGQVPYWCEPHTSQTNIKMDNATGTVDDKATKQEESKHTEKRREKKRSGHCVPKEHSEQVGQLKTTESCLDHAEELNLKEYKCERMHQWVKKHSPETTNDKRHNHISPSTLSECNQDESNLNIGKSKDGISSDFNISETIITYSDKVSSTRPKVQRDQLRNERSSFDQEKMDNSNKCEVSEHSCTCKRSQVIYTVWRACACESGNPAKLYKILSSGFDEKSLDLGYQSIESLEHDEFGVKQISAKAPGFEIVPLCSTPAIEGRNIDFTKHKKVHKERPEACKTKGGNFERSKEIRPPPGFERIVCTGMDYSNDRNRGDVKESHQHGRPDNTKTIKPSLRSVIQQQGLQNEQLAGAWQDVDTMKMRQEDYLVNKEDINNNLKHQNILGDIDLRHLPKVCSSMEEIKDKDIGSAREIPGSRHTGNGKLHVRGKGMDEAVVKSLSRVCDYVCDKEQQDGRKVNGLPPAVFSRKSATYDSSSAEYYETSGDENIQFSVLTQSPQNELNNDGDNEEIQVNEIMETGSTRGKIAVRSGASPRDDLEIDRTRMSFQPRSPYSSFPPPYRGGLFRPRFPPFPHMEQWPIDPRYHSMSPPPPVQWSPPSSSYQMYCQGPAYRPNEAWDPTISVTNESVTNYRMYGEGNAKPLAGTPPLFSQYNPKEEKKCYKDLTKNSPVEEKMKSSTTRNRRPSKNLVDYDSVSSGESSSEIEPFDVNSLQDSGEETLPQRNQLKPTPKKLKTDTMDDDLSSSDSFSVNEKENRGKIHSNATAAMKINRGHVKKLKQKTLKPFSFTEKQQMYSKAREETPKNMVQDHVRKRTLAGIIAESCRTGKPERRLASDTTDSISHDFRHPDSEKEKELPPLPPLPPFPNSPFWSMYSPANSSALTGKSEEDLYSKKVLENSPALQMQRKWLPRNPSNRYSFSPGQIGGVNSPSETDSETRSIKSDWMTNFKLFHNFGVKYIDTHCHLDFLFSREGFKGSFKAYMDKHAETFPDTFEGCVAVFCNPNTFTPCGGLWLDVAKEPNVWIAMGCHPKMATDFTVAAELGLKKCLRHSKCIALGEIGLDYSGTFHQHEEVQKQVFRKQLKMALQMEKVLVIHCRQAEDDCLEILKEIIPRNWKIHCHCFTNEYRNAKLWIDAFPNLFIGVTPLVTYRTARPSHDLARHIPINKLLLETDAPYFVPRCIPKEDLPLSNPGLAITVAKEIAQYQEIPVAAVLRQCRLNTKFMYGI